MGSNNPSLRDVARAAKVSVGTASNFINNPEKVSPKTRKLVQDAINKLGFTPQPPPTRGRAASNIIGLILPSNGNSLYDEIALGIEDVVNPAGYQLLVGYSREDAGIESQLVQSMIDANFRSVILTANEFSASTLENHKDGGIYLALISQASDRLDQCSVRVDQVAGGYRGIEYLHSLGHRKILWIGGPPSNQHCAERFEGITQAVQDLGIQLSVMSLPSLDFMAGEYIAPQILALKKMPDAIFCGNDLTALGVMNEFYRCGVKIPEDVSILGFDNIIYAESSLVPLTTLSQSPYKLGFMIGSQLIEEFQGKKEHIHQHILIDPQIIERSSTQSR